MRTMCNVFAIIILCKSYKLLEARVHNGIRGNYLSGKTRQLYTQIILKSYLLKTLLLKENFHLFVGHLIAKENVYVSVNRSI